MRRVHEGGRRAMGLSGSMPALSTPEEFSKVNWDSGVAEEASQED